MTKPRTEAGIRPASQHDGANAGKTFLDRGLADCSAQQTRRQAAIGAPASVLHNSLQAVDLRGVFGAKHARQLLGGCKKDAQNTSNKELLNFNKIEINLPN